MLERLADIPAEFWSVLGDMAPYLLFGFLVAGALSVFISASLIERHLGGGGIGPVFKAAAFGVPLPLCSCGVIPVAASLRRHGASRGAVTSFLIATPQDGADSILVTFSLLGGVFAVFRPVAALVSALLGGMLVSLFSREARAPRAAPDRCTDPCCNDGGRGRFRKALAYGFVTLPMDIARAMLVGLVIAALISALVPPRTFQDYLGGGLAAMVIMMVLGIPVYVCATASVPLAWALITKGASPGAALVFLMTGPATNAATIAMIWKTMGRKTAVIYLATVAGSALAAGLVLDYLFEVGGLSPGAAMPWMLPGPVRTASAIVLLGVLGLGALRRTGRRQALEDAHEMEGSTLEITGMTCSHCAETIERALRECSGVRSAEVDLGAGRARVAGEALSADELCRAVRGLGYGAEPVAK